MTAKICQDLTDGNPADSAKGPIKEEKDPPVLCKCASCQNYFKATTGGYSALMYP